MARLWLADDDPTYLYMIAEVLRPMGHELTLFNDGASLFKRMEGAQGTLPDLILMDVMMPGFDGYTLQQKLQGDERFRGIPLIVMTAKSNVRELFAQAQNVVAFLEKPAQINVVQATVAKILKDSGVS